MLVDLAWVGGAIGEIVRRLLVRSIRSTLSSAKVGLAGVDCRSSLSALNKSNIFHPMQMLCGLGRDVLLARANSSEHGPLRRLEPAQAALAQRFSLRQGRGLVRLQAGANMRRAAWKKGRKCSEYLAQV